MDLAAQARRWIDEDLGPGDCTTEPCVGPDQQGTAVIVAKQDLVVCGHDVARAVFDEVSRRLSQTVHYRAEIDDGALAAPSDRIAHLSGGLRALLIGERCALNLLMKLSGIATHARRFADAAGDSLRVVDTRKTTPGLRDLEKYAVTCGGAHNHRFGLFDGVLIKDNHLVAAGGVRPAVQAVRARSHHLLKIEVEVTDLDELTEAIEAGADALLLDNMSNDELRRAVARARSMKPDIVLEASGNMDVSRIRGIRDLGLDVVSAGGIIHQATWVDLSMRVVGETASGAP